MQSIKLIVLLSTLITSAFGLSGCGEDQQVADNRSHSEEGETPLSLTLDQGFALANDITTAAVDLYISHPGSSLPSEVITLANTASSPVAIKRPWQIDQAQWTVCFAKDGCSTQPSATPSYYSQGWVSGDLNISLAYNAPGPSSNYSVNQAVNITATVHVNRNQCYSLTSAPCTPKDLSVTIGSVNPFTVSTSGEGAPALSDISISTQFFVDTYQGGQAGHFNITASCPFSECDSLTVNGNANGEWDFFATQTSTQTVTIVAKQGSSTATFTGEYKLTVN